MRRLGIAGCLVLFVAAFGRTDGGYAGSYLRLGVGPRALGIGAFTAVADDASCLFWNPAGLGILTDYEFTAQTSMMSLKRAHNYLAYAHPIKRYGALAVGMVNYSSGNDLELRGWNSFDPEGTFADSQNEIMIAWGKEVVPGWSFGLDIKTLFHDLYDQRAFGLGGDAGLLWTMSPQWSFGLVFQDIYSYLNWSESGWTDVIPPLSRLGAAWRTEDRKGLVSGDLEIPFGSASMHWGLGGEYVLSKYFAVRAGLRQMSPVAGFGVFFPFSDLQTQFDYAIGFDGIDPSSALHRLNLRITFERWDITL